MASRPDRPRGILSFRPPFGCGLVCAQREKTTRMHGTTTPGQKTCAPSLSPDLDGGLTRDGFKSNYAGHAVVAPDLEGLGPVATVPYPYFSEATAQPEDDQKHKSWVSSARSRCHRGPRLTRTRLPKPTKCQRSEHNQPAASQANTFVLPKALDEVTMLRSLAERALFKPQSAKPLPRLTFFSPGLANP
jgi:hypothetical protein